jgi:hypothetical protein
MTTFLKFFVAYVLFVWDTCGMQNNMIAESKIVYDEPCMAVEFSTGRTDKLRVAEGRSGDSLFYVQLDDDGVMHFAFMRGVNIQLEAANCFRVKIRK